MFCREVVIMKRILTVNAKVGMVIAGDIYTDAGLLVVPKGTVLDKGVIEGIKSYSVYDFFIEEEPKKTISYDIDELDRLMLEDDGTSTGYYDKIKATEEFHKFEAQFVESVKSVEDNINNIVKMNNPVCVEDLLSTVKKITDKFKPDVTLFDMLHCIEGYDDSTYIHSLNVALICRVTGEWLKMSQADLDVLTVAGLLHDIGKVMISDDIIKKPGKLTPTEYAIVQSHTVHGYNILKNQPIDDRIKQAALMHHERCDGKGYPNKYKHEEIDLFARIVAIADVYDAMTSNRVYRSAICPFNVISTFEESVDLFDPKFLYVFLEKIAHSYVNNEVVLNDELEGTVVMINKYALAKPGVLVGGAYIDLSRQDKLKITAIK